MIGALPRPSWRALGLAAMTLAIGASGGLVFDLLGMPAAYLAGSMLAVALGALAKAPVDLPMPLRNIAFVVLGAIIGATMDKRTLQSLPEWPIPLAVLMIGLVLLMTLVPYYLQRIHGFDRGTARMCAVPGALGVVVVMAMELNVDARRVAILHTLRLAVLLMLIPGVVAMSYEMRDVGMASDKLEMGWPMSLLLIAACFAVVPVARLARVPSPTFIGPMFLVGALSMTGLVDGLLPSDLLWPALIVSGSVVGARFAGTTLSYMWQSLKAGMGGIFLAVLMMGLLAWPVAEITQIPFIQVWLAYAPGGFDAMPVLAFSLGLDPAYVAGHQLIRLMAISFAIPFLFRPLPEKI